MGAFVLHGDRFVTGVRKGSHGAGSLPRFTSRRVALLTLRLHLQAVCSFPEDTSSMARAGRIALDGRFSRRLVSPSETFDFLRPRMISLLPRESTT